MNINTNLCPNERSLHVAMIMDGNGRWATQRHLPRWAGHVAGAKAIRPLVEAAPKLGIEILTLFAFSSDNWCRPTLEVNSLMAMFAAKIRLEARPLGDAGTRLSFIGRRDRLSRKLLAEIENAERLTANGQVLHLRVAIDYSGRHEIARAAAEIGVRSSVSGDEFMRLLVDKISNGGGSANVDLLIRTGGEMRLSDFLLWECAYAELIFSERLWPDYSVDDLRSDLRTFELRTRRFGGLPTSFLPNSAEGSDAATLSIEAQG